MFIVIIIIVIMIAMLLLLPLLDNVWITNFLLTSKSPFWEMQPELSSDVKVFMLPCYTGHSWLNQELTRIGNVLNCYPHDILLSSGNFVSLEEAYVAYVQGAPLPVYKAHCSISKTLIASSVKPADLWVTEAFKVVVGADGIRFEKLPLLPRKAT